MITIEEIKKRILYKFKNSGIKNYELFLEELAIAKYEEIHNMQFHWIKKGVNCWIVCKKNGVVKMEFYSVDYENKTASASSYHIGSTGNPFSKYYRTEKEAIDVFNNLKTE